MEYIKADLSYIRKTSIEISNGNKSDIELDQIDFKKCFLFSDNFGLNSNWLKRKILESFRTENNEFESMHTEVKKKKVFFNKVFLFSYIFLIKVIR